MEDLDALLDELHSTTNNISSYQQHQQRLASQSGSLTGDYSTIPDSPSHTNGNDSLDSQQPIYEVQTIKTQQTTTQNQSNYDSQAQPQGHYPHPQPPPPQAVQAPPPASPQKMTTLSNNLSELDMLLQDLNSAQFLAEVDRRNTANVQQSPPPVQDGRPSVDNLLDDLQRSVPASPYSTVNQAKAMNQSPMHQTKTVRTVTTTTVHNDNQQQGLPPQQQGMSLQQQGMVSQQQGMSQHQQGMTQQQQGMSQGYAAVGQVSPPVQGSYAAVGQVSPPMQGTSGPAASTATRELDDLMNSLSEFKINANKGPAPQHVGEPAYALPNKARVTSQDATGSSMSATTSSSQHTNAVQGGGAGEGGAAMMHSQVQHVHQGAVTSQGPRGSQQLDTMLGNLQSDMNKHGVATIPKGHCAACSKPIVGQVITALGRIWHPEHFTCVQCHEELGTQNFFERDSLPYCEKDYHQLFSPRCAYCGGPILDKCVTALDKTWHPEHFFCAQCGRPFNDEGFHEKEGKAFCREDYFEMFAPKCGGCNRPIMDNYISALNRQWHPECFVCQECRIPFGGGSFFDHDGLPYCETHYHARRGSLCATCNKPITGRCITAMYRKFHPEHFVCAFCLKQLNKGTFKEQNDKPYCHPCFVKLFS